MIFPKKPKYLRINRFLILFVSFLKP